MAETALRPYSGDASVMTRSRACPAIAGAEPTVFLQRGKTWALRCSCKTLICRCFNGLDFAVDGQGSRSRDAWVMPIEFEGRAS